MMQLEADARPPAPSSSAFRAAMRVHVGGISVIAITTADGEPCGLTATSMCSLSDDPPTLIVCVNRQTRLARALEVESPFAINVPSARQEDIARVFAGMTELRGAARFSCGAWHRGDSGAPLLRHARATFECVATEILPRGTHVLVIAAVTSLRIGGAGAGALAYVDGQFQGVA